MTSARNFLIRGLLAGLLAGLVAFGIAYTLGEPSLNASIAIEESASTGHDHPDHAAAPGGSEAPLTTEVPRSLQSTAGLLTGTLVAGVTLGGLVGVISALALGRFGRLGVRAMSLSVTAIGFVSLGLVPFVAYPPNPPAVGQSDTIGARTGWYLVMVLASVVLAMAAVWLAGRLAARLGAWNAGLAAAGGYVVLVAVVMLVLPAVHETPEPMRDATGTIIYPGFPADVLYDFRLVSLGAQLVLWATIGLAFSTLAGRLLDERAGIGRASIAA